MSHPLTNAAYARFCESHKKAGITTDPMRDFVEGLHKLTPPDTAYAAGHLLAPYWDQIEAKLAAP